MRLDLDVICKDKIFKISQNKSIGDASNCGNIIYDDIDESGNIRMKILKVVGVNHENKHKDYYVLTFKDVEQNDDEVISISDRLDEAINYAMSLIIGRDTEKLKEAKAKKNDVLATLYYGSVKTKLEMFDKLKKTLNIK